MHDRSKSVRMIYCPSSTGNPCLHYIRPHYFTYSRSTQTFSYRDTVVTLWPDVSAGKKKQKKLWPQLCPLSLNSEWHGHYNAIIVYSNSAFALNESTSMQKNINGNKLCAASSKLRKAFVSCRWQGRTKLIVPATNRSLWTRIFFSLTYSKGGSCCRKSHNL